MTLDWLAAAARPAGRPPRPHRGHRLDRHDGRARRRAAREARRAGRRLLRARALVGREGVPPARARASARCRSTTTSACGRTRSTSPARAPSSPPSARPRRARVDPVAAVADACEREGVWLHVDAAYAGSAAVCPELRHHFAGWERADSIVVNPHKWLVTPMDCSTLWTRRPDDFRARVQPRARVPARRARRWRACPSSAPRSAAASARSSSGRCCAATAARGCRSGSARRSGWRRCSRGGCATSPAGRSPRRVRSRSSASGATASDEENEALLERVNATGEIFISHTKLNDRYVLRLAVGSARTTEDDVRARLGRAQTGSGSGRRRERREQRLQQRPRRPRSAPRRAPGSRAGGRSRSRRLSTRTSGSSTSPGSATPSTSDASSSPMRKAIVPLRRHRREPEVDGVDEPARLERVERRRAERADTPARELVDHRPQVASVRRQLVDGRGGRRRQPALLDHTGGLEILRRAARMFVPIFGSPATRSV